MDGRSRAKTEDQHGDRPRKSRVFVLSDAMIFVVAVAAGLSVNRASWPYMLTHGPMMTAWVIINSALAIALPHVVAWTFALVMIRWRRPRPPLRRMARQPGAVACLLATSCAVVIGFWIAVNMAMGRGAIRVEDVISLEDGSIRSNMVQGPVWATTFIAYADRVGFAVGGGWLCLLVGGRWGPEPGWIDRTGRALGWCWVGATAVIWLTNLLV